MELKIKKTSEFKDISFEDVYAILDTSFNGLHDTEVTSRLEEFGDNEIAENKQNPIVELLRRYWGPMPWLLEIAIILSCIMNHYFEGIIIFSLLTINTVIGYVHTRSSQKVIALLRKKMAVTSRVLRNGTWIEEDAIRLVAGDIISVKLGDIVAADAKIISGDLTIDQSALTGESLPVDAHPLDILYSGSIVTRSEATCIVVNIGANTFFGKTVELVKVAKPKSHQEEMMMSIVKYMMYLGVIASVIIAASAFLMQLNILIMMNFIIVVLLGAIPAALPAVLTIVQSVGATELAKKGALVTNLDAVEDAASIDIICFDKTGTITQNKLTVVECVPFSGYKTEDVLSIANMTSQSEGMDLIDMAVIEYAKNAGIASDTYKQISYTPFDPSTKRTESIIETDGKQFRAVKGATQIVISLCRDTDRKILDEASKTIDGFSAKGNKTIAVARSDNDDVNNLKLVGVISLTDPPRTDSKTMIEQARLLGIKPMMLTGDSINIAKEISGEVGIGTAIIRMDSIKDLGIDKQLETVSACDGFAEIYPEDKFKIVKLLQSGGHIIGMTGDGVNDAPALKQAEMGIAVTNSTDVAKAAASVVLTDSGIGVIIDAVTVSRKTYQRMLTWVLNKVIKVIEFVVFLSIGFFWLHDILLSLIGMTFLVFANDFVSMTLATDNVQSTGSPNNWNLKNVLLASLIPALLYVLEDIVIVLLGIHVFHLQWPELTSLVMLTFIINSQFRVMIVRERKHFWSSLPGKGLLISGSSAITGISVISLFGILVPSLSPLVVISVLILSALFSFGIDFPKCYLFKKFEL